MPLLQLLEKYAANIIILSSNFVITDDTLTTFKKVYFKVFKNVYVWNVAIYH